MYISRCLPLGTERTYIAVIGTLQLELSRNFDLVLTGVVVE
jgi:hypothetical protein